MKTTPLTLIRARHRRALWTPALWTAIAGLTLLSIVEIYWRFDDPATQLLVWIETVVLVAFVALLVRLRSRHSARSVACALDAEMMTHNRIEAATELAGRSDPLALAQRTDTTDFLSARRLPVSSLWPIGLVLLLVFVSVQLVTFTVAGYQLASAKIHAIKAKTAAKVAKAAPAGNTAPAATLTWISPKPETTGTPIEEVPLTAEANSVTGLKALSLVVTINGEPRPELPLPDTVAPGRQPVNLSLYLDELDVQPYDMVTYFLRAKRVVPAGAAPATPWPSVTSPLQFLQVRPLRDDTRLANGSDRPPPPGSGDDLLNFIKRLKIVQIQLMRDTFALANDSPPRTDPGWPGLTQAAGSAQTALGAKTHQALDLAGQAGAPAQIVNLITQAIDRMKSASTDLAKPDPAVATTDQGRALSDLTAVEKYYIKIIVQGGKSSGGSQQNAPDPFAVNQPFKLPPREPTPAGQLEQLARDQAQLADQLASSASSSPNAPASPSPANSPPATPSSSPPGSPSSPASGSPSGSSPGSASGSPDLADATAKQQQLADAINRLANANSLPAEAAPALQAAAAASRESSQQLQAKDPAAAAEPAARAAASLRDAIARVDAAGRADTANLLANAQRALNQSAGDVAGATPGNSAAAAASAAANTAATAAALRAAATQQQGNGSSAAADQLAQLANAIAASRVQDDLKKLADAGPAATPADRQAAAAKLTSLAQGTANSQAAIADRNELAAQALDGLRRDRANLDRADQAGMEALRGLHDDVLVNAELAVSAAQGDGKRLNDPVMGPVAQLAPPPPEKADPKHQPFMRLMGTQIDALITLLADEDSSTRPQVLATGQTSEAPPAYRPAVADYFESLAHEPAPTPAQP